VERHETAEDYSSWLLPAVNRILQKEHARLQDLQVLAVATGPGSFTGVRVGLTSVKAWSEVYGTPIAGVSRLEALATCCGDGSAPYVAVYSDAHRGQVFGALYRKAGPADWKRVEEEMVIAPGKFLEWAAGVAGTQRVDWISMDPGLLTALPQWATRERLGENVRELSLPVAQVIGLRGFRLARENRLTDALALDANYVRRSDAEIFWKGGSASHGR
jgi:tRNA threonylcarbamoyladenosine biosynthesis protein TsaB